MVEYKKFAEREHLIGALTEFLTGELQEGINEQGKASMLLLREKFLLVKR